MKSFYFLLLSMFFFSACTSPLEFDDVEQMTIQPVIEGDMLYFDLNKDNLTDSQNLFRTVVRDTVDFDIFKDGKARDSFVKAVITVAYKNTFERQFETNVYFIDEQSQIVDQLFFNIDKATASHTVIDGTESFTFDINNNPNFINFRRIVIAVEVSPQNLPIEDKKLHVKVKGTFHTNLVIE